MDDEFLKLLKLIKCNFWHIAILDYSYYKKAMIKQLQFDNNPDVTNKVKQVMVDINNPKWHEFG